MGQSVTRHDALIRSVLLVVMLCLAGLSVALFARPFAASAPGAGSPQTDAADREIARLVAAVRSRESQSDHALRHAASGEPAIAAIAILRRDGTRMAPADWLMPTYPEQLLLDRVQTAAMPTMGVTAWIGSLTADSELATACHGGAGDVTCLLLRSDVLLDALAPPPRGPGLIIAVSLAGLVGATALLVQLGRRGQRMRVPKGQFRMADLHVDPGALRAWRAGSAERIDLSRREVHLLEVLHRHAGQALSRDRLFDEVWGRDYMPNSRALDQFISTLRRKIETRADRPEIVRTVRGVGYRFDPDAP
ncbi:MAG: winged helix-turn-helix domain-containing protein [Pseudomonadota bacterium]